MGTQPPLTSFQIEFLAISNNIVSIGSFLALIIFFASIAFTSAKKMSFPLKLICNLFFSDFIYSISNLMPNLSRQYPYACNIEGILRIFGCWASVFWATIISYSAYCLTVRNDFSIVRKYRTMLVIGYIVPVLFSLVPFLPIPIDYTYNGAFCIPMYSAPGIDLAEKTEKTIVIQFLFFLGWAWVAIFLTTYYYIRLFSYLRGLELDSSILEVKKILIFPVLLLIAFIPMTLDNLVIFPSFHFPLLAFYTIVLHALGLLNVLAYGYQRMRSSANKIVDNEEEKNNKDIEVVSNPNVETDNEDGVRDRMDSLTKNEYNLRIVLLETTNTL